MKKILHKSFVGLLVFAALILIGFYVIPQGYTCDPDLLVETVEPEPQNVQELPDGVTKMYFDLSDREPRCNTLFLKCVHCEVKISANGTVIYCLKKGQMPWMSTTGSAIDFISLPDGLEGVDVEICKAYPSISSCRAVFKLGNGQKMIRKMISDSFIPTLLSVLDIFLGILMLIFWFVFRKETKLTTSLPFLGLFALAVGSWSLAETNIFIYLMNNHSAASFTSFLSLMMFLVPFIQFTKHYYKRFYRFGDIFSLIAIFMELVLILLHITGIAALKQTVTAVHIMLVVGVFYFISCFISFLLQQKREKSENNMDSNAQKEINQSIRATAISAIVLVGACTVDFYLYYQATLQATFTGRLGIMIYLAILSGEEIRKTLSEIEKSRRMIIYKELAYRDNLTGLYNRNAYMEWEQGHSIQEENSLVNIDLNDLKKCNDEFGHAMGDKYITDSAEIIYETFQDVGSSYRVGGDEFAVVVRADVSREEIKKLLQKIEEKQREYNEKSDKIKIHMAYGFAKYDPEKDKSMETVGSRADARMYAHKKEIKELSGEKIR